MVCATAHLRDAIEANRGAGALTIDQSRFSSPCPALKAGKGRVIFFLGEILGTCAWAGE